MTISNAPTITDRTEEVLSLQNTIAKLVDGIAENARPKGEWRASGDFDEWYECPFCHFGDTFFNGQLPNFCGHCGADLREEGEA